jgi:triacylglycerol lipase
MRLHTKVGAWAKEFVQLFRGPILMEIHREPPTHYLGYTLDGKVPVILIPGVLNKWSYMKKLGDKISLLGHPVHIVPELKNNIFSVPVSARLLHKLVVRLIPAHAHHVSRRVETFRSYLESKDLKGVVLVAHSKGGLIGKYLLAHHNADSRVLGLVAVATPFSGSAMANLMPQDAFKELQQDSNIIRDLQSHMAVNKKIISIYPEYDTHVWAKEKSYLEGAAENIEIPIGGHSVIDATIVQEAVIAAVEKITRFAP